MSALKKLFLSFNMALNLERFTEASTGLNQMTKTVLRGCGFMAVPDGSFANLPNLKTISMRYNLSVCEVEPSVLGKVTCNCASDYFNNSQEMPGGGACIV